MKNLLPVFLFYSAIWSCADSTADKSNPADTTARMANFMAQPDTDKIKMNANFPFGCAELKKLNYPKHWEGNLENYGHLKMPQGKKFEDIGNCFAAIHMAKTIQSPKFQRLEVLKIGDHNKCAFNNDTILQKSMSSCRYRLPNIGMYECYYFYERFGHLLLLDPKTKNGKILNIYADDIGGDSHTILRYYYMDENEITIYEGSCYDDGCTLDEKYKISIAQNGAVNINPKQQ